MEKERTTEEWSKLSPQARQEVSPASYLYIFHERKDLQFLEHRLNVSSLLSKL